MSYHILHQFDEPWVAETRGTSAEHTGHLLKPLFFRNQERNARSDALSRGRCLWLVIPVLSLLVAAAALLFALDARRRADDLQQRLTVLERQDRG